MKHISNEQFQNSIKHILEKASANQNHIEFNCIKSIFSEVDLTAEQLKLLWEMLDKRCVLVDHIDVQNYLFADVPVIEKECIKRESWDKKADFIARQLVSLGRGLAFEKGNRKGSLGWICGTYVSNIRRGIYRSIKTLFHSKEIEILAWYWGYEADPETVHEEDCAAFGYSIEKMCLLEARALKLTPALIVHWYKIWD